MSATLVARVRSNVNSEESSRSRDDSKVSNSAQSERQVRRCELSVPHDQRRRRANA